MIIKEKPEDFIVEEIPLMKYLKGIRSLSHESQSLIAEGKYAVFRVDKVLTSHFSLLSKLSNHFKVSDKDIGTAGIKDRNARTKQFVSILISTQNKRIITEAADAGHIKVYEEGESKITTRFVGVSSERITTGLLAGNHFRITLKELTNEELKSLSGSYEFFRKNKKYYFPNYFGEQRFGNENTNSLIGYYILKKEFKEALNRIKEQNGWLPKGYEDMQPLNALKQVLRKKRMIYVSALQSMLFNLELKRIITGKETNGSETIDDNDELETFKVLSKGALDYSFISEDKMLTLIAEGETEKEIPVCGFNTDSESYASSLLLKIGLTPRDFAIRQMPDLMFDEHPRELFMLISDLRINTDSDSREAEVSFFLKKGSYATMAVEQLTGFSLKEPKR